MKKFLPNATTAEHVLNLTMLHTVLHAVIALAPYEDVENTVLKMIKCFADDKATTERQRGFLSALLLVWENVLRQPPNITTDLARSGAGLPNPVPDLYPRRAIPPLKAGEFGRYTAAAIRRRAREK